MHYKLIPIAYFIICVFFFFTSSCTNSTSHSSKIENSSADSAKPDSIRGNVLFRIKTSDFFDNRKNRNVASTEELIRYFPYSFYVLKGHFFIPNRLSDEIYEITNTGQIVRKIALPIDFDIDLFFISPEGYKYIFDDDHGLVAFDPDDKMLFKNDSISYLIPNLKKSNALILKRSAPVNKILFPEEEVVFTMSDIQGVMMKSHVFTPSYFDYYLGDDFFYEMNYSGLPEKFTREDSVKGFERNKIRFRKYDLHSGKLISEMAISRDCKHCFNLPKLLSEKIIVSSNYDNNKDGVNELLLLDGNGFRTFTLCSKVNSEALTPESFGFTNLGYVYSYDKEKNKLYSLGTSTAYVTVMEYDVPKISE